MVKSSRGGRDDRSERQSAAVPGGEPGVSGGGKPLGIDARAGGGSVDPAGAQR